VNGKTVDCTQRRTTGAEEGVSVFLNGCFCTFLFPLGEAKDDLGDLDSNCGQTSYMYAASTKNLFLWKHLQILYKFIQKVENYVLMYILTISGKSQLRRHLVLEGLSHQIKFA
jgi:hypothetical protein